MNKYLEAHCLKGMNKYLEARIIVFQYTCALNEGDIGKCVFP